MQTELAPVTDSSPRRVLWKLSSCEDFFDRDHDTLIVEVENRAIRFSWDIAAPGALRREVRVWRTAALAYFQNAPLPSLTVEDVYRLILPQRDLRSTELERILSCTHQHIYELAALWTVTRPPAQADGPLAFTVFARESVLNFLRARRLS